MQFSRVKRTRRLFIRLLFRCNVTDDVLHPYIREQWQCRVRMTDFRSHKVGLNVNALRTPLSLDARMTRHV